MSKKQGTNEITLLFITQKIHQDDDDLAFVILWIQEFIRQGIAVEVICLEKGTFDGSFPVHSLGKEAGAGTIARIFRFLRLITVLRYNRVFVHMNPEYVTLGGWLWWLRRVPVYLWYTHYTMHIHVRLAGWLCRRMFAATAQSLPQYEGNAKKVVTGHGIDMDFWLRDVRQPDEVDEAQLLTVHRICRSKRLERVIMALKHLPKHYTVSVYGRDVEQDYAAEMRQLVQKEQLENRVRFAGPLPMEQLKNVYHHHRLVVNMASETIDKTMLESMVFGVFPVTTPGNSQAIGLPVYPLDDTPEAIAQFILERKWERFGAESLRAIVVEKHSLQALIRKMNRYIVAGN